MTEVKTRSDILQGQALFTRIKLIKVEKEPRKSDVLENKHREKEQRERRKSR